MTIALPHRGDDDLRRRRRTFVPARIAQHGPHRFGGEDLTLHHQAAAIRHRLAKQSRRGPHPRFRRTLRPADASQLGRRLHPAPGRDRLIIHGQADAVGAEPVGHCDRHVRIGNGLTDAHRRRAARGWLQAPLVRTHAAVKQLIKAQIRDVVQDRLGHRGRDPVTLDAADHNVHPPADDREQKRIHDRHRQLVAHRGRALRIPVEQQIGHRHAHLPGIRPVRAAGEGTRCRRRPV
jgi:hypothetical protein